MHPCPDCLGDPQFSPCSTCGLGSEADDEWYEGCPFGCDHGTVYAAGGVEFECPCCAGSGIGRKHNHEHLEIVTNDRDVPLHRRGYAVDP